MIDCPWCPDHWSGNWFPGCPGWTCVDNRRQRGPAVYGPLRLSRFARLPVWPCLSRLGVSGQVFWILLLTVSYQLWADWPLPGMWPYRWVLQTGSHHRRRRSRSTAINFYWDWWIRMDWCRCERGTNQNSFCRSFWARCLWPWQALPGQRRPWWIRLILFLPFSYLPRWSLNLSNKTSLRWFSASRNCTGFTKARPLM